MWWRILIPTWRFFDVVGAHPELWVKVGDGWRVAVRRPQFRWWTLLINPSGGYYHAYNNLLERLVSEVGQGSCPEQLVSYALVRDLVREREFKITLDGEVILHSRERALCSG